MESMITKLIEMRHQLNDTTILYYILYKNTVIMIQSLSIYYYTIKYFVFLRRKCLIFNGLYMTRECKIYLYIRQMRINILQYGRRFAYSYRNFISFNTETVFLQFLNIWSSCPLKLLYKLE